MVSFVTSINSSRKLLFDEEQHSGVTLRASMGRVVRGKKYGEGREADRSIQKAVCVVFHWDRWGQRMENSQGHCLQSSIFVEHFQCIDIIYVNYVSKRISTQQLGICGQVNTVQYTRGVGFLPHKIH